MLPAFFPAAFAGDLPRRQAALLATTQRPITFGALTEPSTAPAWKRLPAWYQVGTLDQVIPPDQQLFMARRAHAHISTVASAHLPMISKPGTVANLDRNRGALNVLSRRCPRLDADHRVHLCRLAPPTGPASAAAAEG